MVKNAKKQIVVSKLENEKSSVTPNGQYYDFLEQAQKRGVRITRYYFGSTAGLKAEQAKNKDINYVYGGREDEYQRLVIADGECSMAKIGSQFVYSRHPAWLGMLYASLNE